VAGVADAVQSLVLGFAARALLALERSRTGATLDVRAEPFLRMRRNRLQEFSGSARLFAVLSAAFVPLLMGTSSAGATVPGLIARGAVETDKTAVDIASTAFGILIIFIIVAAPFAFYRKFISKKTRTVGSRPFVSGRDCRACGGWGMVNGKPCTTCGGRRTR
jgi:hypothetical protein